MSVSFVSSEASSSIVRRNDPNGGQLPQANTLHVLNEAGNQTKQAKPLRLVNASLETWDTVGV